VSDDVIFLLAGGFGALFGLWRVIDGALTRTSVLRLIGIASAALVGAVLVDGLGAVSDGRDFFDHYSDFGILVLLFIVMVLPLWGLFDERILARTGEVGIVVLGLTAAARLASDGEWVPAAAVALTSIGLAAILLRNLASDVARLVAYGWFLLCVVLLAVLEGDNALALINDEVVEVSAVPTFAAFAALMWLAFHSVFASKFVLIALTCVRARGRRLALDFGARMIVPSTTSTLASAAAVGAVAVLLGSDVLFDWAPDAMLVAAVIFFFPVFEASIDRAFSDRELQPV